MVINPDFCQFIGRMSEMTGVPAGNLLKLAGLAEDSIVSVDYKLLTPEQFESIGRSGMPPSMAHLENLCLVKYYPDKVSPSSGQNHSVQALADGTVHVSRPCEFNDPFDSLANVDEDSAMGELAMRFAERFHIDIPNGHAATMELIASKLNRMSADDLPRLAHLAGDPLDARLDLAYQSMLLAAKRDGGFASECVALGLKGVLDSQTTALRSCRVTCFAERPDDLYMWAHYAASHTGFCVEYDLPDNPGESWDGLGEHERWLLSNIFGVFYHMRRPDHTRLILDLLSRDVCMDNIGPMYAKVLCSKGFNWVFERERRLIVQDAAAPDNVPFFPMRKVYFGLKMPADRKLEIAKVLEGRGVEFAEMTLVSGRYGLVERPVEL